MHRPFCCDYCQDADLQAWSERQHAGQQPCEDPGHAKEAPQAPGGHQGRCGASYGGAFPQYRRSLAAVGSQQLEEAHSTAAAGLPQPGTTTPLRPYNTGCSFFQAASRVQLATIAFHR